MSTFNVDKMGSGSGKSTFKQPKAGAQEARILRVLDLGVRRPNPHFPDSKPKQELLIMMELAEDSVEYNGKVSPMVVFYSVRVAGKKPSGEHSKFTALIRDVGIKGDFALKDLLGKAVSVMLVESKDKTKVNVASISALSARVAAGVPGLVADSYALDFNDPDSEVVAKLSDNMKSRLGEALNFPGSKLEALINNTFTETDEADPI